MFPCGGRPYYYCAGFQFAWSVAASTLRYYYDTVLRSLPCTRVHGFEANELQRSQLVPVSTGSRHTRFPGKPKDCQGHKEKVPLFAAGGASVRCISLPGGRSISLHLPRLSAASICRVCEADPVCSRGSERRQILPRHDSCQKHVYTHTPHKRRGSACGDKIFPIPAATTWRSQSRHTSGNSALFSSRAGASLGKFLLAEDRERLRQ